MVEVGSEYWPGSDPKYQVCYSAVMLFVVSDVSDHKGKVITFCGHRCSRIFAGFHCS